MPRDAFDVRSGEDPDIVGLMQREQPGGGDGPEPARQRPGNRLDHHHLSAQAAGGGSHLQAEEPGTDDDQLAARPAAQHPPEPECVGHGPQHQGAWRIPARQLAGLDPGGHDERVIPDDDAIRQRHLMRAGVQFRRSGAEQDICLQHAYPVLGEQPGAFGIP